MPVNPPEGCEFELFDAFPGSGVFWSPDEFRLVIPVHSPGQDVHFLKIDVEGHEEAVLRGGNWTENRPWVLVVEATKPMTQEENYAAWDAFIISKGYLFCWFDGLNRYYVAEEHGYLATSLTVQPNYFDRFVLHEVVLLREKLKGAEENLANYSQNLEVARLENKNVVADKDVLRAELEATVNQLNEARLLLENRSKPLWERLMFKASGLPRTVTTFLLTDRSGNIRGTGKKIALDKYGRVRTAFYQWFKIKGLLNRH